MSIVQYITKKTKKDCLSFQDLNNIKQKVHALEICRKMREDCTKKNWKRSWREYHQLMDNIEYDVKKIGVMVADVLPNRWPDNVIIGYSLCNTTLDKFDYIRKERYRPGWGHQFAFNRACVWQEKEDDYFNQCEQIPDSIVPELHQFIGRVASYYRDKDLPTWACFFVSTCDHD